MNLLRNETAVISTEQACLGSCLSDEDAFLTTAETLTPEDFYESKHKLIFKTMLGMLKETMAVDVVTLTARLQNGNLQKIGGVVYLTNLLNSVPTAKNIEHYNILIQKASLERRTYKLLVNVNEKKIDVEGAMAVLATLGDINIKEETLQAILENSLKQTLKGTDYKFGVKQLDEYLGGLDRGELLTIGGYTSQGKTGLAIQMAINFAEQGNRVLFLSTEMSPDKVGRRILSNQCLVNLNDLKRGYISTEQKEFVEDTIKRLSKQWQLTLKKVYSIEDVAKCVRKHEPEILFLDYIQNLSGDDDYVTNTRNIKTLQSLTFHNNISTVCVSQLNRKAEIVREPRLTDLRGTGRIEECSNIVIMMYWKDRLKPESGRPRYGGEPPEKPEIIICKNRDGNVGRFGLDFLPEYAKFVDREEEKEKGGWEKKEEQKEISF